MLSGAVVRKGMIGMPVRFWRALAQDSQLDSSEGRAVDLFSEGLLQFFESLGPVYGKLGQISLSRLSRRQHAIADRFGFTRLYQDWPALPFGEVKQLLDVEVPEWRRYLLVEPIPLGVASIAQAHAAHDRDGREWVIKLVKPVAAKRLSETTAAMTQIVDLLEPAALTLTAKRSLRELRDLIAGLRSEIDLSKERDSLIKAREQLLKKRQKTIAIPDVHPEIWSPRVIVVERFRGTRLADVVAGKVALPVKQRQKLAKTVLSELLVQVFEWGIFHGDPHAGNLILQDDGTVGLFDWGLTGELKDSDRRHIAAILKSVIALDLEQLIDTLVQMAAAEGHTVSRSAVEKELKAVVNMIKKGQETGKSPPMRKLFEASIEGANRLGIAIPRGLLLMVKSLLTLEGLAKGIDPNVSLSRAAGPVLFRAAQPTLKDVVALGKKLPQITRMLFNR
jgi:ubiquinone biosynthesis protein